MLFFDFHHMTTKELRSLEIEKCPHCETVQQKVMFRNRYWIQLALIPIIPYKTEIVSRCTYCSGDVIINATHDRD